MIVDAVPTLVIIPAIKGITATKPKNIAPPAVLDSLEKITAVHRIINPKYQKKLSPRI